MTDRFPCLSTPNGPFQAPYRAIDARKDMGWLPGRWTLVRGREGTDS